MRKDDLIRIRHMLDAAREAMGFAQGRSRTDLANDCCKKHCCRSCNITLNATE